MGIQNALSNHSIIIFIWLKVLELSRHSSQKSPFSVIIADVLLSTDVHPYTDDLGDDCGSTLVQWCVGISPTGTLTEVLMATTFHNLLNFHSPREIMGVSSETHEGFGWPPSCCINSLLPPIVWVENSTDSFPLWRKGERPGCKYLKGDASKWRYGQIICGNCVNLNKVIVGCTLCWRTRPVKVHKPNKGIIRLI